LQYIINVEYIFLSKKLKVKSNGKVICLQVERRRPELTPVFLQVILLKPGGRQPILSGRPAVTYRTAGITHIITVLMPVPNYAVLATEHTGVGIKIKNINLQIKKHVVKL